MNEDLEKLPVFKKKTKLFYSLLTKNRFKVIAAVVILFVLLASISFFTFRKSSSKDIDSRQNTFIHSPTLPEEKSSEKAFLYSLTDNGIEEVASSTQADERSFYDELSETLYYIYDNNIMKLYIPTATEKLVYSYQNEDTSDRLSYISYFGNKIYFTVTSKTSDPYSLDTIKTLYELDPTKKNSLRAVGELSSHLYNDLSYIFQTNTGFVLGSFGGDGCGGGGSIYLFTSKTEKKHIVETGSGCVDKPRLIGSSQKDKEIYLASVLSTSAVEGTKYDVLYSVNVETGEIRPIFDLKKMDKILAIEMLNKDSNIVAIFKKNDIHEIDLNSGEVVKVLPIPELVIHYDLLTADKLFASNYNTKNFYIFNLKTMKLKTLNWEKTFTAIGDTPKFLGIYKGHPLVLVVTD